MYISGGRGYLSFYTVDMAQIYTDSVDVMNFMVQVSQKSFFLIPNIFEYLVIKRKNGNSFAVSFDCNF